MHSKGKTIKEGYPCYTTSAAGYDIQTEASEFVSSTKKAGFTHVKLCVDLTRKTI